MLANLTKADEVRLKSFQKRCLRKTTKADRKGNPGEIDNMTIEELINLTQIKPILETINERRKKFWNMLTDRSKEASVRHKTKVRRLTLEEEEGDYYHGYNGPIGGGATRGKDNEMMNEKDNAERERIQNFTFQ